MRYKVAGMVVLLAMLSLGVAGDYVRATRFMYNQPERLYPSTSCTVVEAKQDSPSCYRDGIEACRKNNAGKCFADCAAKVRNTCIDSVRFATCELPAGWELKFDNRQDCLRDAANECNRTCLFGRGKSDCRKQAYTRCSYIGRIFV